MLTQQDSSSTSTTSVTEYGQEVRALLEHLKSLGGHRGLPGLSEEISQAYSTSLDALAALHLHLHLHQHSWLTHEHAGEHIDGHDGSKQPTR